MEEHSKNLDSISKERNELKFTLALDYLKMLKLFTTSMILFFISISSFGQHTRSLDTLSKKEIKQVILNQNDSPRAKTLMGVHQGIKYISYISYSFGGISLLSRIHTKRELDKLLTLSVGAVFIGTGLLLTAISKRTYSKAVKVYRQSFPSANPVSSYIRDSRSVYGSLYN